MINLFCGINIGLLVGFLLQIRQKDVFLYTIDLCERSKDAFRKHLDNSSDEEKGRLFEEWNVYMDKIPNIAKMTFFFFIPLKDKYWLSKEMIEWLNKE